MGWIGYVLFLGASVGNFSLMVFGLNWFYGTRLSREFLRVWRWLHALFVLLIPFLFAREFGLDLASFGTAFPAGLPQGILAVYAVVCALVGLLVVPAITLRRCLRKPPPVLTGNHTNVVDVAARLGYPPAGTGKHAFVARLPGNESFQVEFSEKTLRLRGLPPALDGLSILHLTDLHLCGTPDLRFFEYVMDRCRDWEPDLVAVTGDIVDSVEHHSWIPLTLGRLRWRIAALAVMGNHDSWYEPDQVRRHFRQLGFQVLGNRWQKLEVRGQEIVVVGNETPWFRPASDLAGCPRELFKLCLSHTPDNLPWAKRHGVDLMLAGHNHGGQVRFPIIGSLLCPSRYGRAYDCGTFHEPPTVLHVGKGLGGQHPLRYNCRPEVVQLILRCGGPAVDLENAATRQTEGELALCGTPTRSGDREGS